MKDINSTNKSCNSFENQISQWVFDKDLDDKALAPVKGHVKLCLSCKSLKNNFMFIEEFLIEDQIINTPIQLKHRVMSTIYGNKNQSKIFTASILLKVASVFIISAITYSVVDNQPNNENNVVVKAMQDKLLEKQQHDEVASKPGKKEMEMTIKVHPDKLNDFKTWCVTMKLDHRSAEKSAASDLIVLEYQQLKIDTGSLFDKDVKNTTKGKSIILKNQSNKIAEKLKRSKEKKDNVNADKAKAESGKKVEWLYFKIKEKK